MKPSSREEWVIQSGLKKDYGLSASLIEKLGAPDKVRGRPRGGKIYYWAKTRVDAFVRANRADVEKNKARRRPPDPARAQKLRDKWKERYAAAMHWAETVEIDFSRAPASIELLKKRFNKVEQSQPWEVYWDDYLGEGDLVIFARERFTNFIELKRSVKSQVGINPILVLHNRVNKLITERYGLHTVDQRLRLVADEKTRVIKTEKTPAVIKTIGRSPVSGMVIEIRVGPRGHFLTDGVVAGPAHPPFETMTIDEALEALLRFRNRIVEAGLPDPYVHGPVNNIIARRLDMDRRRRPQ